MLLREDAGERLPLSVYIIAPQLYVKLPERSRSLLSSQIGPMYGQGRARQERDLQAWQVRFCNAIQPSSIVGRREPFVKRLSASTGESARSSSNNGS